jgi:hypothetical protein
LLVFKVESQLAVLLGELVVVDVDESTPAGAAWVSEFGGHHGARVALGFGDATVQEGDSTVGDASAGTDFGAMMDAEGDALQQAARQRQGARN